MPPLVSLFHSLGQAMFISISVCVPFSMHRNVQYIFNKCLMDQWKKYTLLYPWLCPLLEDDEPNIDNLSFGNT